MRIQYARCCFSCWRNSRRYTDKNPCPHRTDVLMGVAENKPPNMNYALFYKVMWAVEK